MSRHDDEMAVAEFIRAKGVTRCPTVCANVTQASLTSTDRAELERHAEAQEAVRLARSQFHYSKALKTTG